MESEVRIMKATFVSFKERLPEYANIKDLVRLLGVSKRTVQRRIDEMEKERERYGDHAVIRDDRVILVNYMAFIDFEKYRKMLAEKNARKYIPDFNPGMIRKMLGEELLDVRQEEMQAM